MSGILAVFIAPTLYPPKAAANAINNTDFVFTVDTRKPGSPDTQFVIPTSGPGYNYTVDCNNDGVTEVSGQIASYTCNYTTPGIYTIRIGGVFPWFIVNGSGDKMKLLSVDQWGTNKWKNMRSAFAGAENMDVKATDTPDLSQTTDLSWMFIGNKSLKGESANWNWNTSTITKMSGVFQNANQFNQSIGSWDVSKVTDTAGMFNGASAFNNGGSDSIANWDTSNLVTANDMFRKAASFNQPIGSWNMNKVQFLVRFLSDATSFNQSLAAWQLDSLAVLPGKPLSGAAAALDHTVISRQNYDAMLIAWNSQNLKSPMSLGAAGLKFCAAVSARANILKPVADGGHGWTITSDGKFCTKHRVVFDSQSGSAVADKMVSYTDKIIAPAAPTRQGYTFAGWYADAALTGPWDFANDTMPDNSLTLYAKWTKNPDRTSLNMVNNNSKPAARLADTGIDIVSSFSATAMFLLFGLVVLKRSR
ncbi:BspA family leucine-rich repeat surface protein [TM7 phylum sp. oral taxon 353]|nr:BspA family leucine-rich repeat surface protein [TM7 phylum sp. oral taxon 353]